MSDLTKPEHVPSCVSTGEGVTVPHVAPSQISGELIMAGNMYVGGDPEGCEPVTGYVVKSTEDEMRAVASLPMYRRVAIVPVDQLAQAQAALAAKDREIAELTDQLRIVVDAESFRARKIERERDQLRAEILTLANGDTPHEDASNNTLIVAQILKQLRARVAELENLLSAAKAFNARIEGSK